MQPGSSEQYESFDPSKSYKVGLNPEVGSKYHYEVTSETHIKTEYDDKSSDNVNKTTTGTYYQVSKDSSGNFLFHITYDSIHIYTKNKDGETDLDMANAPSSIDPVEKMMGLLKAANITATITPSGDVRQVSGYNDLTEKIMASFAQSDSYTKDMARKKWDQLIDQGIIKKNMDQLFKIFPDSAIRIGGQWKLNSQQDNGIVMNIKSIYTLKAMNSNFTLIESEGKMASDTSTVNLMGYDVLANLHGTQKSEYQLETKTGMLLTSKMKAHFEGSIQLLGKEIPVDIETTVVTSSKKMK